MKYVYKLEHSRKIDEEYDTTKLIGFFSSKEKAEEIIENYKKMEGFRDYPEGFTIEECEIDFNDWEII